MKQSNLWLVSWSAGGTDGTYFVLHDSVQQAVKLAEEIFAASQNPQAEPAPQGYTITGVALTRSGVYY